MSALKNRPNPQTAAPQPFIKRQAILARLNNTAYPGKELKKIVAELREAVDEDFLSHRKGIKTAATLALSTDRVLSALLEYAGLEPSTLCVIATGGYGRGLLAPYSDLDLTILHPAKAPPELGSFVSLLWDMGLKIGYHLRPVDTMPEDHVTQTALLDARPIWGSPQIFQTFQQTFWQQLDMTALQASKLKERNTRLHKYDPSPAVVEPDIKHSAGGLRELDLVWWLAKIEHGSRLQRWQDLNTLGLYSGQYSAKDLGILSRARKLYWQIRLSLHLLHHAQSDKLTFPVQPEAARLLGYRHDGRLQEAERLLRHYHLLAREVQRITNTAVEPFANPISSSTPLASGFAKQGNMLISTPAVTKTQLASMQPYALLLTEKLHLAPALMANLKEHQPAVTPANSKVLRGFFTDVEHGASVIRAMHNTGALGSMLPAMKRLTGLMQFDMYHRYTVDEHSLRSIEILHRLARGGRQDVFPFATELYNDIFAAGEGQENENRASLWTALCVGCFCHDLGKGLGGNHSPKGAQLVADYAPILNLSEKEKNLAAWLVENHLRLSFHAFRRDLGDPETIAAFVAELPSALHLQLLYILTVVDIKATNPDLLTDWKRSLLQQLYRQAHAVLQQQNEHTPATKTPVSRISPSKQRAERISALRQANDNLAVAAMPDAWLLAFPEDIREQHLQWLQGDLPFCHARCNEDVGVGVMTVLSEDRAGLFADLTAILSNARLNITEARLFTIGSTALDVFTVQNYQGDTPHLDQLQRLAKQVTTTLAGIASGEQDVPTLQQRQSALVALPTTVEFDTEGSAEQLIIEVTAVDQPGLLHYLAATLRNLKLSVKRARIATLGGRVVDTFYVVDGRGNKITNPQRLNTIRQQLQRSTQQIG